jgi:hypothetical protein
LFVLLVFKSFNSLYIVDINPLSGIYFLTFCRLFFNSGSFPFDHVQTLLSLTQSHLSILALIS